MIELWTFDHLMNSFLDISACCQCKGCFIVLLNNNNNNNKHICMVLESPLLKGMKFKNDKVVLNVVKFSKI